MATETKHQVTYRTELGQGSRAECSCGWRGHWTHDHGAEIEGREHIESRGMS